MKEMSEKETNIQSQIKWMEDMSTIEDGRERGTREKLDPETNVFS